MDLSAEFPLREDIVYLNHAAVAPWPRRTAEAVRRFADENLTQGAQRYADWLRVELRLREQLQALLNAGTSDDIALLKNTSEALSLVAFGLEWRPGDNVVASNQEFPSNRIVWQALASQGVSLREADLADAGTPEEALFREVDEQTRLITVSSVQYATGLRMDLARIGAFCRAHDILLCVDAIQSLGALEMDVRALGIDFLMADGHKWLLGPEGLAVFYCNPRLRESLQLREYGWHMVAQAGDFEAREWRPAASARRFECGSPNMLGIHALSASLSLLLELGIPNVSAAVLENARYLFDLLDETGKIRFLTPRGPERHAGIVTFRPLAGDVQALQRALSLAGVICAQRGDGIRFSPHFYLSRSQLERAVTLTAHLLA